MNELNEVEVLKARLSLQESRIAELEGQNKRYLEVNGEQRKENEGLKKSIRELVEKKTTIEKEKFKLQGENEKLKLEIEEWKDRCAETYWDS